MGAVIVVIVGTAVGTLLAIVAQHYLRQALKRWIASERRKD
jgi:hypothetical protein